MIIDGESALRLHYTKHYGAAARAFMHHNATHHEQRHKCIESGSSREKRRFGEGSLSLRSSARGVVLSMRRMWLLLALEGVRTSAHELAAAHGSTTTHKGSAARMQRP